MRTVKLYIAMSLNGYIAAKDGSVDWLEAIPNPDKTDHGYREFYDTIDTTIQGYKTYQQIIDWGIEFPYSGKKNYVLTRKQHLENTEHVDFISENPIDFIKALKQQEGKGIWVIGGGHVNTLLLNDHLIDELIVFVMPIIVSEGIGLFENLPKETRLRLLNTKQYSTGAIELNYQVNAS